MKIEDPQGVIFTRDLDLAAVFSFFQLQLQRMNPAIIVEEIKWSDLKKGIKPKIFPRRVTWKFLPDRKAFKINESYCNQSAHEQFDCYVDNLALDDSQKETLKALHSASVARAGAEILQKRRELLSIQKSAPDTAILQAIVREDGTYKCFFGKAAPLEIKARFVERE